MTARRSRLLTAASITAVVAATALTSAGNASATSSSPRLAAAPVPITHSNGAITYSCIGGAGVAGNSGWVQSSTSGPFAFTKWAWGTYYGGVEWAPDGSEMVHMAKGAARLWGFDTQYTSFMDEPNGAYPWQLVDPGTGITDLDQTFTADGRYVLFTRSGDGPSGTPPYLRAVHVAGTEGSYEFAQPPGGNSHPAASVTGDVAFENVATSGPTSGEHWVWLLPVGSDTPVALAQGSRPKFSPDGSKIAFLDANGTTLSAMNTDGSNIQPAGPTTFPGIVRDFAWSPDGTQFLFGIHVGNGEIATSPVAAGSSLTDVPVYFCTSRGTYVSWQPVPTTGHEDQVVRVWGSTRQDTSVATSHAGFPTPGSADAVVLADSYHFPDALSGAPLATHVHGPMLLTPGSAATVWPTVLSEIDRVTGDKTKPIYLLGQTGSVSQGIQDQLTGLGYTHIVRLGGANRYETSLAIANFMGSGATAPGEILLATGTDFPDGLSAGAAAASYWTPTGTGGAVLLTNGNKVYPAIQTYITNALKAQTPTRHVYVTTVGGLADKAYPGTLSNPKISAVGADRYTTSAYVAEIHFGAQSAVAVATGTSFPDALSGGAFAGSINAPLLLAPPSLTTTNESPYFLNAASGAITTAYVFGGTSVVNSTQVNDLRSIIGVNTIYAQITPTTALSALKTPHTTGKVAPFARGTANARGTTSAVGAHRAVATR